MRGWDADPAVRRFERDTLLALAGIGALALVVRRGNPDAAVGVVLGGLLVGGSYWAIKGGVDLLLTRRASRRGAAWRAAGLVGRYALLALAAYVMLARFHAHPVGVLGGVTAPFLAAIVQLLRLRQPGGRLR